MPGGTGIRSVVGMVKQTESALVRNVATMSGENPRRPRHWVLRACAWTLGGLLGAYLVGRGVTEFFTISYNDPASYRLDWGGPSLAGVIAVHSGPGAAVLVAAAAAIVRRLRSGRPVSPSRTR